MIYFALPFLFQVWISASYTQICQKIYLLNHLADQHYKIDSNFQCFVLICRYLQFQNVLQHILWIFRHCYEHDSNKLQKSNINVHFVYFIFGK